MRISPHRSLQFSLILSIASVVPLQPALAEPVKLPAGMSVSLILQHHVNSGYTPAGSPVYFRIADDVIVGEQVLIAKDSLVVGKMMQANERGMVGRAGSMLVSVDNVTGVDGTRIPVDADLSKQGRSRGGATVGWTLFWGLPGLITKGVNPYMEKGELLQAVATSETLIDPSAVRTEPSSPEMGAEYAVTEYRWAGDRANGRKTIDIERKKDLKNVAFKIALPPDVTDAAKSLESLRLYQANGVTVPEEVRPFSVQGGAAVFDAWSIARYCGDGHTSLLFIGTDSVGRPYHAGRELTIEIKKKKKKS